MTVELNAEGSTDNRDLQPTLGVLFVHGIGTQRQGETLVRYGDSLAQWFTRWLSKGQEVESREDGPAAVLLRGAELEPGETLSARVRLKLPDPIRADWLLAESWWADTFRAPRARPLLQWMLAILPYMLVEQFFAPLRRSQYMRANGLSRPIPSVVRYIVFGALLAASLPLAGLGIAFLVLLLVPMLIPVERLRDLAKRAVLKLADTLGDSFVLTSSPVQFDAMTQRVARDLQALSTDVNDVVVVAHSQGTAVAYEAIARYGAPPNLTMFVTLGQALGKLARARELRRRPERFRYLRAWLGVLSFYALAVFLTRGVVLISTSGSKHLVWMSVDFALAAAGLVGMALVLKRLVALLNQAKQWNPDPLKRANAVGPDHPPVHVAWRNYYASADPVPNGPLFDETNRPAWMTEIEVWNHASVLTDHTSYPDAPDGFLGLLAVTLLNTPDELPAARNWKRRVERALWRRWWRVWWLAAIRLLAIVGGIAGTASITLRHNLHDVGNLLPFFRNIVYYVSVPLRSTLGVDTTVLGKASLAGLALIAVVVAAGYALLVGLWRHWDARDLDGYFSREAPAPAPLGGYPFGQLVTALALVTTVAALVVVYGDYPTSLKDLAQNWVWTLISIPVIGGVMLLTLRNARLLEIKARKVFRIPPHTIR